tara:strand:- start:1123 stop:1701 length:579 start_codon:yes stop_codon:yes gene_type:complete
MSSLKLLHSGGNGVIISAPSSNPAANRTITVPGNADGEMLTTTNPKTGNIIQVVGDMDATAGSSGFSTSSASYVTNSVLPTLSITPSKTSSKIYVSAFIGMQNDQSDQCENTIYRVISGGATTDLSSGNTYGLVFKGGSNAEWGYVGVQFVDSPNTTSQVTYTWYGRAESAGSVYLRHPNTAIGITLMEIAA